jgi:hypothetical protein
MRNAGRAAVRYDRGVIKNHRRYAVQAEAERWEVLRGLTVEESIAIGEALLTSDIMRLAEFPDDDHPVSLAVALGLRPESTATQAKPDHDGE